MITKAALERAPPETAHADQVVDAHQRGIPRDPLDQIAQAHQPPRGSPQRTAGLVGGMQDLAAQVHWASEGSWLALQRVLGAPQGPAAPASETTFDGLQASLDRTIERLQAIDPAALEAGLLRVVELPWRGGTRTYRGDRFLLEFALPSFFFHLTLVYAILRQRGVPLEKGDFMGS